MLYLLQVPDVPDPGQYAQLGGLILVTISVLGMAGAFYKTIQLMVTEHSKARSEDNSQISVLIQQANDHIRVSSGIQEKVYEALIENSLATHDMASVINRGSDKLDDLTKTILTIAEGLARLKEYHEDSDKKMYKRLSAVEVQLEKLLEEIVNKNKEQGDEVSG